MVKLVEVENEEERVIAGGMLRCAQEEAGDDPFATPGDTFVWLLENEEGEFVGVTALHSVNWIHRRARGLLWIEPPHRHKGYGTIALNLRNSLAFSKLNLHRVEWAIPETSLERLNMAEVNGEVEEGVVEDAAWVKGKWVSYHLYRLLSTDYSEEWRDIKHMHSAMNEEGGKE